MNIKYIIDVIELGLFLFVDGRILPENAYSLKVIAYTTSKVYRQTRSGHSGTHVLEGLSI